MARVIWTMVNRGTLLIFKHKDGLSPDIEATFVGLKIDSGILYAIVATTSDAKEKTFLVSTYKVFKK